MEKEIINIQVLLEIALNQRVSNDINSCLPQIMNLYLRKLNGIAVAIYRKNSWEWVLPKALKNNQEWVLKMSLFEQELKSSSQEAFLKVVEEHYFYAFPLQAYGWLVLIRKRRLAETMFFELNKVIYQLGRDLCHSEEEQRFKVLQQIFDKASDGIQVAEESGRLYYVNDIASKRLGIPAADVATYHVCDLEKTFLHNLDAWKNHVEQLKIKKTIVFDGEHIHQSTGQTVPVELTINMISVHDKNFIIASARDITQRLKQEQEIKETNQKLTSVFNEMSDVVWSLKLPSLEVLFVSPSVESIFEVQADAFIQDLFFWQKMIVPQDAHIAVEIRKSMLKSGDFNVKYRVKTPSGKIKWIRNKGKFVYDDGTHPIRIDGVITDRTRQYLAQEALDQELKLQEALIDIASTYINLDPKDVENTIHQSLEKMGLFVAADRAYIFDYDFIKQTTSNTYEWCQEGIDPEIHNLQNVPNEFFPQWVEQHRQGKAFYIQDVDALEDESEGGLKSILEPQGIKSLIAIPMLDGKELIGFVGFDSVQKHHHYSDKEKRLLFLFGQMLINIRNRQKWDNQLRLQEEKYRNIIANMNLGLLEVDLNDRIVYANQTFCDMSGFLLVEMKGKKAADLFVLEGYKDLISEKNSQRRENKSDSYEIEILNKSGEKRWWFISGAPHYNDKGQLIGSIGIHLDITEQKILEIELAKAKTFAEAAAKAKELFLANMSHEIRTPLNVIIGMIRQLTKEQLSEEQHFYVKQSESSAKHLLTILNNVLDIAKIESGDMEIIASNFSPSALAYNVHSILYSQANDKNLKFDLLVDPNIQPVLIGDDTRLRQVLINLVGNAIKFTEKGQIKLTVSLISDTKESQKLRFEVMDSGVGMSEAFISRIFDKFSQEHNTSNRKYEGTGLGLAISNDLIQLMGGQLEVFSSKNEGSLFRFELTLPLGKAAQLTNISQNIKKGFFEGKKALLVEDNEMNRFIATQSLEYLGFLVREAENGLVAVEYVKKQDFDVIFMDIQMPVMDGLEATTYIRETLNCKTPIIALTANAFKHDIELYLQKGMDDYVTKPYDEEDLFRKIDYVMQRKSAFSMVEKNSEVPLYDLSQLKQISRGNQDFESKMLDIFKKLMLESTQLLQEAIKENEVNVIKKIVHKIKPSLSQMGVASVAENIYFVEVFNMQTDSENEFYLKTQEIVRVLEKLNFQLLEAKV